ncbi:MULTISPECIES: sigma-54-dependent Fis family transcriptional regulator [Stenotrophomonas]|uniref:Sigma-54-dependent Fis family transcriptional regulator n=4 Tax=Stenotrophomonas maltophilia group TaxID=995085 RepID=A0A270N723_STEMA|nr:MULTISPECIES: sigma-54-dependent Fis family transcriptional regulator [Stenotrophomonas]MBN4958878.1 sigma-54-dependent Fis family transcriptional regulator [Stenotrophomonas maltophilia]MBN4966914.1 sigma-54-dependent Fis family transcriptional regulator [Stenotrophomonas maltophilia]MCU1136605.1 sigma-54-dependent Fis family transcriptional regulator [Stenotrophomonas maltophilia]MCU1159608.1 sigma-54-dependent Fis family transcriptional regulator [Stenotrophomonas maltophilia]MCU1203539.
MSQPILPERVGGARRAFFERGAVPAGVVPDAILQSWRRCQRQGLSVDARPDVAPVPEPSLRELRQRRERLWRLARPELEGLAGSLASSDGIVLLTDEEGWVLDAEGSNSFLDRAGQVALMPGVRWDEGTVGTNAIGTAIVEGRALQVRGGEHFFAPHGILTCSATPIFDPFGQRVGVLDISGDARHAHLHALALGRQAVDQIEHRYFADGLDDCELLHLHAQPLLLGSPREALLGFRNGRLVAANRVGLGLFGLDRHDIGHASYEALFDQPLARLHDDGMLLDRQGRALYGHSESKRRARAGSVVPARAPRVVPVAPVPAAPGTVLATPVQQQLHRAVRVLDAGLPVLVQGETGTGKEVFARELHRRSTRAGQPLVAVNCAALPEGLIEAELFGYEEGAFTGARRQGSTGLLRQAQGGVLFLDEIGDMPLALQPRLLRVLQERELSPLGGGRPVKLDFALVCASHRDLQQAVADGRFRADLYYRIADHVVHLPTLRELDERGALLQALWAPMAQGRVLQAEVLELLQRQRWPGNLRQLQACLRTLVALSDPGEPITAAHLPADLMSTPLSPQVTAADSACAVRGGLRDIAEEVMRQALQAADGNISAAAKQLGISRSTLYRRLGRPATR